MKFNLEVFNLMFLLIMSLHIYVYISVYMYLCVCVYICMSVVKPNTRLIVLWDQSVSASK